VEIFCCFSNAALEKKKMENLPWKLENGLGGNTKDVSSGSFL
jgi:hypothetical protein